MGNRPWMRSPSPGWRHWARPCASLGRSICERRTLLCHERAGGAVSKAAAGPTPIAIRPAGPFDLTLLAELHAACFDERWDAPALASLLAMPGALAFLASSPLAAGGS